MNNLRNCILIALAFDATPAEVDAAHEAIDRVMGNAGGVDPAYLVTATVPSNNGAATNAEVDADGLPWDGRIHASTKTKTAKNVWTRRRGVDDSLVKNVEAELRKTIGAAAPAAGSAPPPVTQQTLPPPPGAAGGLPPLPGANAAPSIDPAYAALVDLIARNTNSPANPTGQITEDWLKSVLTHYGVAEGNLQNLAHNLALVAPIADYLASVGLK